MRYEPTIDRARLLATVRQTHGLAAERLAFVPVGFAAVCYIVHGSGGERFFLKLWPRTRDGRALAARQRTVLPLLRALAGRGLLPRVPVPMPARDGALMAASPAGPFALFPYLEGQALPPWPACPPALRGELARTIAAIHRATPALADVLPPREVFTVSFAGILRRGLAALEQLGPAARLGQRALRDLLLPRRAEVVAHLAHLRDLGRRCRRAAGPMVLCHTDLGGDNLLVDDQGHLWVLDWDEAMVAPPEHDLHCVLSEGFADLLAAYVAAGGAASLHLDQFAFSLQRRYLGDLTARLVLIMEGDGPPASDEEALAGIVEWGLAPLARLDATLAEVAAALRASGVAAPGAVATAGWHADAS
jgi:spectinomycin phosphotransferase